MAYKLIQHIGNITQADNNASSLDLGKLSPHGALRISEFGGQDGFFKITEAGTTVTATNGSYIGANKTVFATPEESPTAFRGGRVGLENTDGHILLESGIDNNPAGRSALLYDNPEINFVISHINESSGSNSKIYVEEVTLTNTL